MHANREEPFVLKQPSHLTNKPQKNLVSLLSLQNTDLFEMIERMQVRRLRGFYGLVLCVCLGLRRCTLPNELTT